MNIEDAINELSYLVKISNVDSHTFEDLEDTHIRADEILCEVIETYIKDGNKITEQFRKIDKWYS